MARNNKNKHFIKGSGRKNGYDRWRFVFTGYNKANGEPCPFYIEYYLLNPAFSPRTIIFQNSINNSKDNTNRPSYIMIKAGSLGRNPKQFNSFFTADKMAVNKKLQSIHVGECLMSYTEIKGSLSVTDQAATKHPEYHTDSGSISWNLQMAKDKSYGVGYPASLFFRMFNSLEMFWNIQGLKTAFTGTVTIDGQEYVISPQTSFGYTDSYWGKGFPNPWIWLCGSNVVSQISGKRLSDTCFAVSGCYTRLFNFKKKQKMIIYSSIEGEDYEFNFAQFWRNNKVTFQCVESGDCLHWLVSAQNRTNVLDIDIFCKSDEMMLKIYEPVMNVNGSHQILYGGTGYGELRLYKKVGKNLETIEFAKIRDASCEYGEFENESDSTLF